jgi:hypothetical protein
MTKVCAAVQAVIKDAADLKAMLRNKGERKCSLISENAPLFCVVALVFTIFASKPTVVAAQDGTACKAALEKGNAAGVQFIAARKRRGEAMDKDDCAAEGRHRAHAGFSADGHRCVGSADGEHEPAAK